MPCPDGVAVCRGIYVLERFARSCAVLFILALSAPGSVAASDDEDARRDAVEQWEPFIGLWEGEVEYVATSPAMREQTEAEGWLDKTTGVRIRIPANGEPEVSFLYPGEDEWRRLEGTVRYFETRLGFVVHLDRAGGVWIEKQTFTLERLEERQAALTITRTVHNWYMPDDAPEDVQGYFYVFSAGELVRRSLRETRRPDAASGD